MMYDQRPKDVANNLQINGVIVCYYVQ